jgi:hypothetical protein
MSAERLEDLEKIEGANLAPLSVQGPCSPRNAIDRDASGDLVGTA